MSAETILSAGASDVSARNGRKWVRIWLYFMVALVFAMVMLGGATRLTDSGLSITEWKPIHGVVPPLSDADWQDEFSKYQQSSEYQKVNKGMSLDAFKRIFWWEWAHRFLGRFVGVAFFVPLVFFWVSGRLDSWTKPRVVALFLMGGFQGAVGWWMVASGLVNRVDVAQERLAVHLTIACGILAYALWLAQRLKPARGAGADLIRPAEGRGRALTLVALALAQIFLGGLVAGLHAGLTYNTWPLMDGDFVPSGLLMLEPAWWNFVDNVTTVQFQHRCGAYFLLAVALWHWWRLRAAGAPSRLVRGAAHSVGAILVQAGLGIATLLLVVPFSLALTHQAFAVMMLMALVIHAASFFPPRPATTI
ncbi:COX15/CtaA family protein [Breoghania sp.]|uniref:COX15/CtaA family protein n=1 Tax=Breoghania sp. TaxID=2065378 RepID=UPI0029C9FFE8|nr:COX15/CtaA family protein [Breoghania sp.]